MPGIWWRVAAAAIIAMSSWSALADGGRVVLLKGTAWIERGDDRIRVYDNSPVREGDILETGPASKLQWWLSDDSIYTLGSQSRMRIEEFKLQRRQQQQSQGFGRLALNLLKGGFRTITGFIGSRQRSAYSLRTPVATMGIRGTDYVALMISAEQGAKLGLEPGLYVRVQSGAVELGNDNGRVVVGPGQIAFVDEAGSGPRLVLNPPAALVSVMLGEDFQFEFEVFQDMDAEIRIEPEEFASPS